MTQPALDPARIQPLANAVRALSMDAVEAAKSGHPGMPMGMADVATVLWTRHIKFDPKDTNWADRDRFVLSAGHGSMLLYSILHLIGVDALSLDELKNFRQLGSKTAGHPEFGHAPGIETTTGPLGQGLSTAVGMAMGERIMNAHYGDELVDHRTWVIASDGDLQEGVSQEAISLAGHLKLNKLVVLWDDNSIQIDGDTGLSDTVDHRQRFESAGWMTLEVDGHDAAAVDKALNDAKTSDKPVMIACKTTIGFGAPTKAGTAGSHGAPLGADEIKGAREALGWSHEPFVIPDEIYEGWRFAAELGGQTREAWEARLAASDKADAFKAQISGQPPKAALDALDAHIKATLADTPALATRASSGKAIEAFWEAFPGLIGGSADLTGSNNTRAPGMASITPDDFSGSYVHYGVREFGMAAAMNGLALHGGLRPYSGTFLVFSDYCRGAIRLSALMNQPVIYVFTHDSIGLGEDGPTHQPVEHLTALRSMPNVAVYRPGDAVEAAEAWKAALERTDGPTVLVLSRQKAPHARQDDGSENLSAKGAYVIREAEGEAQVTLIGTGTELSLAIEAQDKLKAKGVQARVVSAPSLETFLKQDPAYRKSVVNPDLPVVAVEAAIRWGWDGLIGLEGGFVGMDGFGASAPAEALYAHFGITADAVVEQALARV
ncbi:transketolase [Oceanicaulis sp. MMSF_3324]|uniref:transketolase n=1 Tax=Oceanicaulis sp. MMSF_3324 TaxID=3046702 RepID=UPI00273DCB93|nr:transketolase [Oceanicaulis sp. MMSF_3324]